VEITCYFLGGRKCLHICAFFFRENEPLDAALEALLRASDEVAGLDIDDNRLAPAT
jgi:hypothetical protein